MSTSNSENSGRVPKYQNAIDGAIFSATRKADAVFNAARAHSRRVHIMKMILPIAAIVIAIVFSWYTFFAGPSVADLVILNDAGSDDGRLTMTEPTLQGYTNVNKPYSLRADKAIQDSSKSGVIELDNIDAELPLGSRGQATVDAQGGIYDNINGRLQLDKPFTVTTSDGIVAKFLSADVNLSTSQVNSSDPVDIQREGQHLKANGLRVEDNGQVLIFHGGVNLLIDNSKTQ